MNKIKIWLGKDTNYNYAYYRVIGEMDEIPAKAEYFTMKWKRWTPKPVQKFSLFRTKMHLYTKWELVEQETLFKITNKDNPTIFLVELVEDEK